MKNFYSLNLNIPLFDQEIELPRKKISMLDTNLLNKELVEFLKSVNLRIPLVEVFFKNSQYPETIHIDSQGGDYTKLNWVFGGGQSKMCWYKPKPNVKRLSLITEINTLYFYYERADVELIESTQIINPTIIQVGIPHSIIDVTQDRFCVSLVLRNAITNRRVSMKDTVSLLEKYIK